MGEVLTVSDAIRLADIIRAAQGNRQVARLIDGEVFYGTARSVGTEEGYLAMGQDVRECFLRVTLTSGFDAFWPVRELLAQISEGEFLPDYDAN